MASAWAVSISSAVLVASSTNASPSPSCSSAAVDQVVRLVGAVVGDEQPAHGRQTWVEIVLAEQVVDDPRVGDLDQRGPPRPGAQAASGG